MSKEAMKRFLIETSIENAEGSQTWYVDATSEAEALKQYKQGGCDIYASNVDVTSLGEPEISGETTLDDFGDFAEQPQQEPVAWPAGLIERIKAAEQRIQDGHAPRRIPADPTDVDLVLAEVRYLLEGKQPPFWVNTSPPAQQQSAERGEPVGMWMGDCIEWTENPYKFRKGQPIYTSPPASKPWVGLTDKDYEDVEEWVGHIVPEPVFYAIEAKLREKNT